jgi:hypothetical protein
MKRLLDNRSAFQLRLLVLGAIIAFTAGCSTSHPSIAQTATYTDVDTPSYRLPAVESGSEVGLNVVILDHDPRVAQSCAAFSGVLVRHPKATLAFPVGGASAAGADCAPLVSAADGPAPISGAHLAARLHNAGIDLDRYDFIVLPRLQGESADMDDGEITAAPRIETRFGDAPAPFGPFADSLDVFDDHSVILVRWPAPERTIDATGVLVTQPTGERYFFVSALAWPAHTSRAQFAARAFTTEQALLDALRRDNTGLRAPTGLARTPREAAPATALAALAQ